MDNGTWKNITVVREAVNRMLVAAFHGFLQVFRLPGLNSSSLYALWGLPFLQPCLEHLAARRAHEVYRRARRECPAYRLFLQERDVPRLWGPSGFAQLPETSKENYVKAFSIEDRCHGGRIPLVGVVIDESSGSSGTPNNWVRGFKERASVGRLIRHGFRLRYGRRPVMFLNCFALGPWATGMNVSMAMLDMAILKSIGPDKMKLENTLHLFGPAYDYVIAGYPPFVKDWLDHTTMDLTRFRLHAILGGEGYSIGLRSQFERSFKSVISSYGASDLEINIAAETELSIALRRRCHDDRALCRRLFGREDPPMLFQYNPLDYLIEQAAGGELVVTVLRRANIAPKIRYNIRDLGGSLRHREVRKHLRDHGIELRSLARFRSALPFLYVYGRNDLSVPFYGAKVFAADLERILNETPALGGSYAGFQLEVREETSLSKTLVIHLERRPGVRAPERAGADLNKLLYHRLQDVNQDFREVSKLFGPDRIEVRAHDPGCGPFAGQDIRVKRRYVAEESRRRLAG